MGSMNCSSVLKRPIHASGDHAGVPTQCSIAKPTDGMSWAPMTRTWIGGATIRNAPLDELLKRRDLRIRRLRDFGRVTCLAQPDFVALDFARIRREAARAGAVARAAP